MAFISITRLRVRSVRFLPFFAWHAVRTRRQVSAASGFHRGSLLADGLWTFWTMTAWDNQASMRAYMTAGSHGAVMPRLAEWCDEASAVHWEQQDDALPSWAEADRRMRESGRPSKVRHPTARHASLDYRAPRTFAGAAINPKTSAKPDNQEITMRKLTFLLMAGCVAALPAFAMLPTGTPAPDFSAPATLGGSAFSFHLADALKKGPVVVYFYPAAFTSGCTAEAHAFAAAMPQFAALHTTVVGVSMDGIEKLKKFSVSDCASKFALASDADGKISHAYDAVMMRVMPLSSRTSYVISPAGKVAYDYEAMDPDKHVDNTLNAVRNLQAQP